MARFCVSGSRTPLRRHGRFLSALAWNERRSPRRGECTERGKRLRQPERESVREKMGSGPEKIEQRQECAGAILQELTVQCSVLSNKLLLRDKSLLQSCRTLIKNIIIFFLTFRDPNELQISSKNVSCRKIIRKSGGRRPRVGVGVPRAAAGTARWCVAAWCLIASLRPLCFRFHILTQRP